MKIPEDEQATRHGDTVRIDLWYPGCADKPTYIQVGLIHVRAADDIRISYDFGRDGWVVEQASVFQWEGDDPVCDPCWKEAAFIPAWQFEQEKEEQR